jgi:transposase
MRQASKRLPDSAEKTVRDIRRATRRHHSAEEKIRIVLEGLRGENSFAELCRKEGIHQNLYYRWSKEFLEAGKKRLAGDTAREATSDEVKELMAEARQLKETLAEVLIENHLGVADRLAALDQHGIPPGDCPCVLPPHHLCVVIELRPNALASPRTARLTNDIHP